MAKNTRPFTFLAVSVTLAATLTACSAASTSPSPTSAQPSADATTAVTAPATTETTAPAGPASTVETSTVDPSTTAAPSASEGSATPTGDAPTAKTASTKDLTVNYFGDSFAVGAAPGLEHVFKKVETFAAVSEQPSKTLQQMREHASDKVDVVVLHTGNNGEVHESDLVKTLDAYTSAPRVIVVLPRTPKEWTTTSREVLSKVAPSYSNVRVVDWNAFVDGKDDDYLVHDHVHPNGRASWSTPS